MNTQTQKVEMPNEHESNSHILYSTIGTFGDILETVFLTTIEELLLLSSS